MENKISNLITCKDCGKEYSKRENVKCEVEISGEEVYGVQRLSFLTWIIGLIPLIILIIFTIKEGEGLYLIGYFPALFWIIITVYLERGIGINYKKKKAEKLWNISKKQFLYFLI